MSAERLSFLGELQRRNVHRAAVFYAGAGWLLVQIATQVFPFFHVDEAVVRWIVIAAVIGFPFAMLFSWFYEWTPQGIKRESEVVHGESITQETGKKLDKAIIAVLGLAVVVLLLNQFVLHRFAAVPAVDAGQDKSIAVLPFVNMSGEAANDYFSDGITEEILDAATQLPGLRVAARTSAFQFKGQNVDLRKVGETLAVAYVLEGSVQRAGDEVRITAQLIDARSGYHRWSGKFDRKLTNLFSIEDEIAGAIAAQLKLQLGDKLLDGPLVKAATANPQAHELYLRGLALMRERGPGLVDAARLFEDATVADANYAEAWGALAQTRELLPWYNLGDWDRSLDGALAAADKALAADPNVASAVAAQATVHSDRGDYAQAETGFAKARALAPESAEILDQYAQYRLLAGDFSGAADAERRAIVLDPLSPDPHLQLGILLIAERRFDEARQHLETAVRAEPNFGFAHELLAFVHLYQGHAEEAETEARLMAQTYGAPVELFAQLARAVIHPEQRPAVLAVVRAADMDTPTLLLPSTAVWDCLLGDCATALVKLERWAAVANREEAIRGSFYLGAPAFDPLRDDPRFGAVLHRLGLPLPPNGPQT